MHTCDTYICVRFIYGYVELKRASSMEGKSVRCPLIDLKRPMGRNMPCIVLFTLADRTVQYQHVRDMLKEKNKIIFIFNIVALYFLVRISTKFFLIIQNI